MPFLGSLKEMVNLVLPKYFFQKGIGIHWEISVCVKSGIGILPSEAVFFLGTDLLLEQIAISSSIREMASTE